MRNDILHSLGLFVFIMGFCLFCSNCRVLQKSKSEYKQDQKASLESEINSEGFENKNESFIQEEKSIYEFSQERFSDLFKLNYQPIFDSSGNIIPLIFKHTKNGITEEIYLSGGDLNQEKSSSADRIKEVISNKINTTYKSKITYKTHTTYKIHTTYVTKIKEKDKTLKDFGFSFWFGIISTGIVVLLTIYKSKLQNTKFQNFINRIFNGKS